MSDLSIVNLSNYSSPEIKEVKNKNWVFYGEDNNYFKYLIDRYNGSPTNNAIINGISAMVYGKGLDATDSNKKPEEYAKMMTLFKKDIVRKLVYDYKLLGQCAIQIIYSKDRKSIAQIEHLPIETIRAEKANEDGEIEGYYYFEDWTNLTTKDEPIRIPAFGTSKEAIELMYIKPYKAGYFYYSPVDYQGGLQYAELEEEIANYHLNNIKQGLAPSMLINFNNGTPTEEQRTLIERRIYQKFSGSSNAGKFILAFNDNADTQASIEPIQLNDAHNQYQFLSEESSKKILVSHRIVSPMLFGIKDQTGLGNNADELKTASILTDNTTIRPFQDILIDCFDKILAYNNINLKLYFKTLQPLEFTDLTNVEDKATKEEETGVKSELSEHTCLNDDFDDLKMVENIEQYGEDEQELINMGYELVDERPVDYDQEETLDKMINLASVPRSRPRGESDLDGETKQGETFLVRYQYAPLIVSKNSREFCRKMVAAKKIYRKEDLNKNSTANGELAAKGETSYNLWLHKGGANCKHYFLRKTFMFKGKGFAPVYKQDRISKGIKPPNKGFGKNGEPEQVAQRPTDRPDKGYKYKR